MKITGATVECPTVEVIRETYPLFLDKLENLIADPNLFQEVLYYIIQLEWCDQFYKLIKKEYELEHNEKLPDSRKQSEYERFFENVIESIFRLRPYLYCKDEIKLQIPLKQPDSHKRIKELLPDDEEALELIYKLYPFAHKRMNNREKHNKEIDKFLDSIENKDKKIRAAKWQNVQPVKNKIFEFHNVSKGQVLALEDEHGNSYTKITKIELTDISGKTRLQKDTDYTLGAFGDIIILPPLLNKCNNIKVVISAELSKFKRIQA